jgi:hypothetical protein
MNEITKIKCKRITKCIGYCEHCLYFVYISNMCTYCKHEDRDGLYRLKKYNLIDPTCPLDDWD